MKIEEAKDILENVVADEVVGIYCKEIQKETDCSKNCEKEDCFIQQAIDTVIAELHALQNLLDEKNEEIEHLQKENEKYISGELMTRNQAKHFEEIIKKYYIHKDKIREKIEEIKNKKVEDMFVTSTQSKLETIFILEDLLKEE